MSTETRLSVTVTAKELQEMLCVSHATLYRQLALGNIPEPMKLGKMTRWRREEVEAWIAAGMPTAKEWEEARKTKRK